MRALEDKQKEMVTHMLTCFAFFPTVFEDCEQGVLTVFVADCISTSFAFCQNCNILDLYSTVNFSSCNNVIFFLFQLAVGQSHFAVVTVENELFTWAVSKK